MTLGSGVRTAQSQKDVEEPNEREGSCQPKRQRTNRTAEISRTCWPRFAFSAVRVLSRYH